MIANEGYYPMPGGLEPIYFRSWDPGNATSLLVCIHGAGGNSADYSFLAERLADPTRKHRYRIIAFDSPGSGLSEKNASVAAFAVQLQSIQMLLRGASLPVSLLASSGGAIASLTCLYQNRGESRLEKIPVILSEPAVGFDAETIAYIEKCEPFLGNIFQNLDAAESAWDQSGLGSLLFDDRRRKRMFIHGRLRPYAGALRPAIQRFDPHKVKFFNLLEGKGELQNPSLILWGELSVLRERYSAHLSRALPNSETRVFSGAGHPLSLSRVKEVTAIAEFLDSRLVIRK